MWCVCFTSCNAIISSRKHSSPPSLFQFAVIWPQVREIIADVINDFCDDRVGVCCPGAVNVFGADDLDFLTFNQIILTYTPFQVIGFNGFPLTTFGLYATSLDNNDLCNFAYGVEPSQRRKRQLAFNSGLGDSGLSLNDSVSNALAQDVITEAIRNASDVVNDRLTVCCNTSLTAVQQAEVEPTVAPREVVESTTTESSGGDSDMLMPIMLGVLLPLIFILVIVTVITLFVKM